MSVNTVIYRAIAGKDNATICKTVLEISLMRFLFD